MSDQQAGEMNECVCGALLPARPGEFAPWGAWRCLKCGRKWCHDCGGALDANEECPAAKMEAAP